MGPMSEAILSESSPMKDLSWIDRMYHKLESVCVEVDKDPSVLFQETTKYVEVQMNAVGTNVRRFCTELIQDLLPPAVSSDETIKKVDASLQCNFENVPSRKPQQTGLDVVVPELSVKLEDWGETPSSTEHESNAAKKNSCMMEKMAEQEKGTEEEDGPKKCCNLEKMGEPEKGAEKEHCQQESSDFDTRVNSYIEKMSVVALHRSDEREMLDAAMHGQKLAANFSDAEFSGWFKSNHYCESDKVNTAEAEEDQEQWAQWYASEGIQRLSASASTNCSDNFWQVEACQEDVDSEWELI